MTFLLAALGAKALYLLFIWLGSAIAAQEISKRKGYGEKPGLAAGLLLSLLGVLLMLVIPRKKGAGGDSGAKRPANT